MKILLCGATGFIGKNLHQRLKDRHEVIPIGRDLCNPEFVNQRIRDADVVIQAAAVTSGSRDIINTPWLHVTDNAVMNSYITRAAHENGVKQVIFFSCSVMYPNGLVNEQTPPNPHPRYFGVAHTKLYIEKLCEFYASLGRTRFTVIRHSNIYGPHDKFDLQRGHVCASLIAKVMQAKNGGHITVFGAGEERRDLLHIDDLGDFIETAMEKEGSPFELYNCGNESVSIKELAARIVKLSNKNLSIQHDLSAPGIHTDTRLDCSKAQVSLGWQPRISLDEGLKQTMEWYQHEFLSQ